MVSNLSKLYTHEDPYHTHKTLGIFCLLHFLYRLYLRVVYNTMFLEMNTSTIVCVCVHILLSMSSFVFSIPKRKVSSRVVIWEETRTHSIIFTLRSIMIIFLIMMYQNSEWDHTVLVCARWVIIMTTMLLADIVSNHYKHLHIIHKDDSVMRKLPYPDNISNETTQRLKYFYSISQIGATLICLITTDLDSVFILMLPIQVSMLLSTLNKKGIISTLSWHIWYSVSLLIVLIHSSIWKSDTVVSMACKNFTYLSYILLIFFRFFLHTNKYLLWTMATIGSLNFMVSYNCFIPTKHITT